MGSGKTLVSKELEKILGRKRVSTDDLIEAKEGKSITDIFAEHGEEYFRACEKQAVEEVSGKSDLIIDCGGGIVLDPSNIDKLRQNGIIIHLSITADSVLENTRGTTNRPLLNVPDPRAKVQELLDQRRPLYETADYSVVSDNKTIPQLAKDILEVIENV